MSLEQIVELDNVSIQDYIKHMRNNATWGGAIEIKAFCEMYNVNVEVINIRNNERDTHSKKEIKFLSHTPSNRWVSITWNGGHFEPVVTKY